MIRKVAANLTAFPPMWQNLSLLLEAQIELRLIDVMSSARCKSPKPNV